MVVAWFSLLESAVPTGMVCSLAKVVGVKMGELPKLKDFAFFRLRDASFANTTGVGFHLGFVKLTKKCAMGRFEFAQAIA